MVIDDYTWHAIHKVENEQIHAFSQLLKQGKILVFYLKQDALALLIQVKF